MLLDFDLGDAGIGLHLIRPITELGLRVVMLTGETSRIVLAECVEAGAMGIISKREPFEHLIEQVSDVVVGRNILSVGTRELLMSELRAHRAHEGERLAPFSRLTVRESRSAPGPHRGQERGADRQRQLRVGRNLRSHIKSLLAKLGVNSQLAAVAAAQRAGWTSPHTRPTRPS